MDIIETEKNILELFIFFLCFGNMKIIPDIIVTRFIICSQLYHSILKVMISLEEVNSNDSTRETGFLQSNQFRSLKFCLCKFNLVFWDA